MKLNGIVTEKLSDSEVKIVLRGSEHCCGDCSVCAMCASESAWTASDAIGADVGDEVVVKRRTTYNIVMIILGYFFPIAFMFIFYYMTAWISEYAAACFALGGIVCGFFLSVYVKYMARRFTTVFRVVKIKQKCRS